MTAAFSLVVNGIALTENKWAMLTVTISLALMMGIIAFFFLERETANICMYTFFALVFRFDFHFSKVFISWCIYQQILKQIEFYIPCLVNFSTESGSNKSTSQRP
jgi:hypothetical protein